MNKINPICSDHFVGVRAHARRNCTGHTSICHHKLEKLHPDPVQMRDYCVCASEWEHDNNCAHMRICRCNGWPTMDQGIGIGMIDSIPTPRMLLMRSSGIERITSQHNMHPSASYPMWRMERYCNQFLLDALLLLPLPGAFRYCLLVCTFITSQKQSHHSTMYIVFHFSLSVRS